MICPNCNQEHPDGFQLCPATGKKIELMKACTNPNCPDRYKYMLPADSRFCPTCGEKLEENNAKTNGTLTNATDELHKFFPVAGITLGETSFTELKNMHQDDGLIYSFCDANFVRCSFYDPAGSVYGSYCDIGFNTDKGLETITEIRIDVGDNDLMEYESKQLFSKWHELGFDWAFSYGEWKRLFLNMGYKIKEKEPRKRYVWEKGSYLGRVEYLNRIAVFTATAPDHSIKFEFSFLCDESGLQLYMEKPYYSIKVVSGNSYFFIFS